LEQKKLSVIFENSGIQLRILEADKKNTENYQEISENYLVISEKYLVISKKYQLISEITW